MTSQKWSMPLHRTVLIIVVPVAALSTCIYVYSLMVVVEAGTRGIALSLLFIAAVVAGSLVGLMLVKDVLHSVRRRFKVEPDTAVESIGEALKGRGLSFEAREPKGVASVMYRVFFELGGNLKITVLKTDFDSVVYVGPVRADNRAEVERLKELVEGALEWRG